LLAGAQQSRGGFDGTRVSGEAEKHFVRLSSSTPAITKPRTILETPCSLGIQVEEAARHIDRSIEIKSTYARSHWNKALVLARQAKSDEAYEIVDQGLQQRPIYLAGVNAFALVASHLSGRTCAQTTWREELAHKCCEATGYA